MLAVLCLAALCSAGLAETLTLPNHLTSVQEYAFYGNTALKTVVLPEGLQTIQAKAFASSGVTAVNLPDSLTFIAEDAFDKTYITDFTVKEGTYAYTWVKEHGYFDWKWEVQQDGTAVITAYTGSKTNLTIPEKLNGRRVSGIGDTAFVRSQLVSITIPGTVDRIGEAAFAASGYLKSITVEQGVKEIGNEAFSDCPRLIDVTLPQSGVTLGDRLFRYCTALGTVTLPGGITKVPYQCFWDCRALLNIIIPEGVTEISDGAFYACRKLLSISLPDSLTTIGKNAFHACLGLETLTLSANVTYTPPWAYPSGFVSSAPTVFRPSA